ncbi:MAG: hypothetical protein KGS45_11945 [Planctomycetes bacterium]|nr:hypothetical protein [Planctomycetota bacterium]
MGTTQAARAFLASLVDYAGLFPPAKLSMAASCENFARYLQGEHEWMLGRFVCPVSRLRELSQAAAALMPGTFATSGYREYSHSEPWVISAVIDGALEQDLDTIERFCAHHAAEENGLARVDCIEMKVMDAAQVDSALDVIPANVHPFFEVAVDQDVRGVIAAMAGNQCAAKVRTGGIVATAFPTAEQVARFIVACVAADVPFKATAGLHHAVRGEQKLTYEKDSAKCTMFGFLNVFAAATVARVRRASVEEVAAVLMETKGESFSFTEQGINVGGVEIDAAQVARVRETFALSFGSCSFEEPVQELQAAGIIS